MNLPSPLHRHALLPGCRSRSFGFSAAGAVLLAFGTTAATAADVPEYQWTHYLGNTKGPGYSDGPVAQARFTGISGMVYDPQGNLYVADSGNHTIRRISASGQVTTLAGSAGEPGFVQGQGSAARFSQLKALTRDNQGNLYAGDGDYIRKITPSGAVSVFAGIGQATGLHLDGHRLTVPLRPEGMGFDPSGNLWFMDFVPDAGKTVLRVIHSWDGAVVTLADLGATTSLAVDNAGRVTAHLDAGNGQTTPSVVGVAGPGNGQYLFTTDWGYPKRLAADPGGTLLYAGTGRGMYKAAYSISPAQWTRTPFSELTSSVQAMAVDPDGNLKATQGTAIYNITGAGLFSNVLVAGGESPGGFPVYVPAKTGTFAGVHFQPAGLAPKPGGGLYTIIATGDYHTRGAYEISPAAGLVLNTSFSGPWEPRGIATSPNGTVWIAYTAPVDAVYRFQNGGVTVFETSAFPEDHSNGPGVIAADAAGNAYVSLSSGGNVYKISAAGQASLLAGFFTVGTALAVDGTGSAARFASIRAMTADAAGNVFVGDQSRVRKITPGGVVTTLATLSGEILAITVDAAGNLYATIDGPMVVRLSPAGTVTRLGGLAGRRGLEPGDTNHAIFNSPRSIAIGADGYLYVGDTQNLCVYRGADVMTLNPVLTTPVSGTFTGKPITVSYSLPEAPFTGSVYLFFSGQAERALSLTGAAATAGAHTLVIDPADPAATPGVASVIGGPSIPEGAYDLTVSTRDTAGNAAATATAAGIVISSASAWNYNLWRQLVLKDPAALESGDADQDSLPNLIDYAVPESPSAPRVFQGNVSLFAYPDGTRLRMTLPRDPLRADVTVIVEASTDLQNWTALATSTLGSPFTGPGYVSGETAAPGLKTVEIRDTVTAAAHRYLRVRALKP